MNRENKLINNEEALGFLEGYYSARLEDFTEITEGKHSTVYRYVHDGRKFVVRFNVSGEGFKKDRGFYDLLQGLDIPLPEIFDIKEIREDLYVCISEFVSGHTVRSEYRDQVFSSLRLQFEMIEKIFLSASSQISMKTCDYIRLHYGHMSSQKFNWNKIKKKEFFEEGFYYQLVEKIEKHIKYTPDTVNGLVHGDFGNDNLLVEDGKIVAVLDWANSYYGDLFLDVGRVVLYCPDREVAVKAAIDYFRNNSLYINYRERIYLGVYFTMITNYQHAAAAMNKSSCLNTRRRLQEFEDIMEKTF